MEKLKTLLSKLTCRQFAWTMVGTAILSFGIYNIHRRAAITEGGVIGLVLLLDHWLRIPASISSPLLDFLSYALAFRFLGWKFVLMAGISSISLAGFYRLWESFPPMLPDLSAYPLVASILGGIFVGIGVGIIVRQGGSSGGDDALALVINKLTGWKLSASYLFTDLVVLGASLSYISPRRIAYSIITVTISSYLIDFVARRESERKLP